MSWGGNNVYYSPESFGLETIGEIEWSDESYSFNLTAVWKKSRGEYYVADDSGCSCPSPFEDYASVESLDGPYDKAALRAQLNQRVEDNATGGHGWGRSRAELTKEVSDLLDRIK